MHVELHERLIADHRETVHLARFDDENVAGAGFKLLAVDDVAAAPRLNELDLVVRMSVWTRPTPGLAVEEKDRDADAALVRPDEVV